jgi:hypothetical protein
MVVVRETVAEDWQALRDIRLTALRDAPDAFAMTYAEQVVLEEQDWLARIARGGSFLAGPRDATSVRLWVTETNKPARMLYERCGFSPTGERQPLPSKPHLSEIAMTRPL